MKTFWYALLDRLLGGWLSSLNPKPSKHDLTGMAERRPAFHDWARDSDHFQQVKVYLSDDAAWLEWFQSFTPDALMEPQGENRESELYDSSPVSFPCVVIATRRLGSGLVRADLYWDFVYPADFPGYVPLLAPIEQEPAAGPDVGPEGLRW